MCNQLAWNIFSLVVFGLISASIIYIPSERSICCHNNDWRLIFLWAEALLLSICSIYISICLISNTRNENSKQIKVLLKSKTLFEFAIVAMFFLCAVSNTSVLGGIDINDEDEFPTSLLPPKLMIRSLRVLVAGLLAVWIFVYDMRYLSLAQNYAKLLHLRRFMHGFLLSMMLFQAVRFGVVVFLWPRVIANILAKTARDGMFFSITLPVSNMFWLKCFFKLWESEPQGATHQEATDQPINVGNEIAERIHATILKQMNIKLGFAFVIALALVGIMYAMDLLERSERVYTGCSYGVFRIILSTIFILLIILIFVRKWEGTIAVFKIHFHGIEMFQFVLFFFVKILVNVLNGIWFSDHPEGECQVAGISIAAQVVDGVFNILQFLCLLVISHRHEFLRSSIFYLLLSINCGLIWFDLSVEAMHLKHYTDDYVNLNKRWVFLLIQAIFWIGLEFHIVVVELLIMQRLETPFEARMFLRNSAPIQSRRISKYISRSIPPNFFSKANSHAMANTVYTPLLVETNFNSNS